jgi:hypothetical protein
MDAIARNHQIRKLLAAHLRVPCVLLVHPNVTSLAAAGSALARDTGWPQLSVAAVLCPALAALAPPRRGDAVQLTLEAALGAIAPGPTPVVVDAIDLLSEPSLQLDPLAVLRILSRTRPLAALWPGSFVDGSLCYAVPEHSHFRRWSQPGLGDGCIIPL